MRSLRAELENWNYNAPTEWNPTTGDILVGIVKDYSSCDVSETMTVQEEETGALVLVRLDDPQLANLIKLQRPRVGDRIGFKNTSKNSEDSDNHYVLMIDRQEDSSESISSETQTKTKNVIEDSEDDETTGATEQERLFIEQELENITTPTLENTSTVYTGTETALREIIKRQDDEINRQAEIIEKLESMLSTAIPLIGGKPACETASEIQEDIPCDETPDYGLEYELGSEQHPRKPRKWAKYFLTALAMAASCGLGVAAHLIFNIP